MSPCLPYLSLIHAPSLEELSLTDCELNDEDLEEISRTIIVNFHNLIELDLSRNDIQHISDFAKGCLPRDKLRVLILDDNPIVAPTAPDKPKKESIATSSLSSSSSSLGKIKELVQFFPYLGYLGQGWGNDSKSTSNSEKLEVLQILQENRIRSRRAMFQSRILDHPCIVTSLWPLMLENAPRCFFVFTWDVNRKYSDTCSITQAQDMMERDAIFILLRDRGAGEIFR